MAIKKKSAVKRMSNKASYGDEPLYFNGMPADDFGRKIALADSLTYYGKINKRSDHYPMVYLYAKDKFSKDEVAKIKQAPNNLIGVPESKLVRMILKAGWIPNEYEQERIDSMFEHMLNAKVIQEEEVEDKPKTVVPKLSPVERIAIKTNDTILCDLDEVVDKWIEGDNTATLDIYTKMKEYDLKGPIPSKIVIDWANEYIDEFTAAVNKTDDQLAEAYSHLTKTAINKRIKVLKDFIKQAESFTTSLKAKRAPRKKTAPKIDKQIAKLQYLGDSSEYHIASINPIGIIGAMRLYTFNAKTRILTEYISIRREGFEIKGTSLLYVDMEKSRKIRLRDPGKTLPSILKGTMRQIDNTWKKLTTVTTACNTRINKDTILLKVGK
jgi:hypothetical protein